MSVNDKHYRVVSTTELPISQNSLRQRIKKKTSCWRRLIAASTIVFLDNFFRYSLTIESIKIELLWTVKKKVWFMQSAVICRVWWLCDRTTFETSTTLVLRECRLETSLSRYCRACLWFFLSLWSRMCYCTTFEPSMTLILSLSSRALLSRYCRNFLPRINFWTFGKKNLHFSCDWVLLYSIQN